MVSDRACLGQHDAYIEAVVCCAKDGHLVTAPVDGDTIIVVQCSANNADIISG